jgi:hypothetical protein
VLGYCKFGSDNKKLFWLWIYRDEDDFDDSCLMIDDEPEEVQKAFEDFLKMSSK